MSGAREKVTDDPLSLFGNAPVERAKVATTEDPLAMFGGGSGGSGSSSTLFAEEEKKPVVKQQEETVFKKLDETKISFAAPKKKKNDADAVAVAEVSPKNDKLGAAAWQSDLAKSREPKIDTTKDLLAELGLGGSSGANNGDESDNLFGSSVSKGGDFVSTQNEKSSSGGETVHIRGAADEAESSHTDLKVSAMLEREEDLDFDLFGKAKTQEKPKPLITKKNADIFEMESDEYFNELEKVATKKEKDITSSKSSSSAVAPAPVAKELNIDVSSMDLNDYIAQQSASSGGGLFD